MISHRYYVIIACVFVAVALLWSQKLPLFEAPDELSHLRYAEFIAEHGRLPDRNDARIAPELWESFQPPLYYSLLAGLIRLGIATPGIITTRNLNYTPSASSNSMNQYDAAAMRGNNSAAVVAGVYRLRMLNTLFGGIFIWLSFQLMRVYSIERWGAQLIALWISVPAIVFSAATLSNDMLTALFCAAGLLCYAKYRESSSLKFAALFGLFFGLAMMTKLTALFLWAPLLLLEGLRTPRLVVNRARLTMLLLPVVVSGYFVLRSLTQHPMAAPDPTRMAWINSTPLWFVLSWILVFIKSIYTTLATSVGVLGAQVVWMPGWIFGIYAALFLIFLLAAWGSVHDNKHEQSNSVASHTLPLASLAATLLLILMSVIRFRESGEAMHARLLLCFVPGFIVGIAAAASAGSLDLNRIKQILPKRTAIGISILCVVALLLPENTFTGTVGNLASLLKLKNSPEHYSVVSRIIVTMFLFCAVAVFTAPRILNWLQASSDSVGRRIIWFAAAGMVLNIGLLFFYVLPLLGA